MSYIPHDIRCPFCVCFSGDLNLWVHGLRSPGKAANAYNLLSGEKMSRRLYANFIEAIYDQPRTFLTMDGDQRDDYTDFLQMTAASSFPEPRKLFFFRESFDPNWSKPTPGHSYPLDHLVEYIRFIKLMASALSEEESRRFAEERFGVDDKALAAFAAELEPMLDARAKVRATTKNLQAFTGKRTAAEYAAFLARTRHIDDELCTVESERLSASANLLGLLSRIPLVPDSNNRQRWEDPPDPFDQVETEYRPEGHELRSIDQNASARRGVMTVKVERSSAQPMKSLHVLLDVQSVDSGDSVPMAHFARARVTVECLIKFARLKNVSVYVSSSNNDYFQITPDCKVPVHILTMRLLYQRSDKPRDEVCGFQTKQGFPKNFLYLSASQGKVNAVKHVLGKKTRVIAKNFSELGMDIFPRLKIADEE